MLVTCPIVRIGQIESGPRLAPLKEDLELLHKGLLPSKQLYQTFWIMRSIEPVVPSIPFDIVVGENVKMLSLP